MKTIAAYNDANDDETQHGSGIYNIYFSTAFL
jgi:hypothetical protein